MPISSKSRLSESPLVIVRLHLAQPVEHTQFIMLERNWFHWMIRHADEERHEQAAVLWVVAGEYNPDSSMQNNLTFMKITFPAVYESENRSEKQKTKHYDYRRSTGDTRGWGSPWYIFLQPSLMEKNGDTLTKKTFVINGEMIADEGEKFIREKLGLPAVDAKSTTAKNGEIEVCDPADKKATELKNP